MTVLIDPDAPVTWSATEDPPFAAVATRLGLDSGFSTSDFVEAVEAKFQANAEALAAVNDQLREQASAAHEAKVTALLDKHSRKFPPADRAMHREFIASVPGGFEKFEQRFAYAPNLLEDDTN